MRRRSVSHSTNTWRVCRVPSLPGGMGDVPVDATCQHRLRVSEEPRHPTQSRFRCVGCNMEVCQVVLEFRGVKGKPSRARWQGRPPGVGDAGPIQERRMGNSRTGAVGHHLCHFLHHLTSGPTCLFKEKGTPLTASPPPSPPVFPGVKARPSTCSWSPPSSPAQVPPASAPASFFLSVCWVPPLSTHLPSLLHLSFSCLLLPLLAKPSC